MQWVAARPPGYVPAMPTLAVLVPVDPSGPPGAPESLPMGRAALALATEGISVVFATAASGGRVDGLVARAGVWEPVAGVAIAGAYDRYPSKGDAAGYAALIVGLAGRPVVNPPSLAVLCRDKVDCQRHLEARGVPLPEVEDDPARFAERLAEWGAGFLKPRYGAFGIGVRRVVPGDPLPEALPGAVGGPPEPAILQRAVAPPGGWAGVSVRILVQRDAMGRWVTTPGVARRDRDDPVVNVARGAEVALADDVLEPWTVAAGDALAVAAARALGDHPDGTWLAELGVDLAVDPDGRPWLIEVNNRPRGRLEVLADADPPRFAAAHLDACARPLRFLAARADRAR